MLETAVYRYRAFTVNPMLAGVKLAELVDPPLR